MLCVTSLETGDEDEVNVICSGLSGAAFFSAGRFHSPKKFKWFRDFITLTMFSVCFYCFLMHNSSLFGNSFVCFFFFRLFISRVFLFLSRYIPFVAIE